MPSFLLLENGDHLLLEDGTSKLILDEAAATTDVIQSSSSFYDLLDLVTKSAIQTHLTEDAPPPVISMGGGSSMPFDEFDFPMGVLLTIPMGAPI